MKLTRILRCAVLAAVLLAMSAAASAGVFISVNFGPPALPVYEQPPCPAEGYMWTPGYWAYGPYGYYWVPGTWVLAPQPGFLWTPGYWGWSGGLYYWHGGYWGPTVGFYGGVPYGYGYNGAGFYGGYWRENHYYYNQNVTNVNVTKVTNVYNTTVVNNNTTTVNRVSYNGGPGGIQAQPTPEQERYAAEKHMEPTSAQVQHETTAQANPQLRASVNQGRPSIAATTRPGEFSGNGVVAAARAGAPYKAPAGNPSRPGNAQNNVPRPPSAANESSRPANTPREGSEAGNVPRPPSSYQPGAASRDNESRSDNAPREGNAPRPNNAPRPEPGVQRESQPHSQPSRPESAPPREAKPRQEQGQHPESQPHPEPHENQPH